MCRIADLILHRSGRVGTRHCTCTHCRVVSDNYYYTEKLMHLVKIQKKGPGYQSQTSVTLAALTFCLQMRWPIPRQGSAVRLNFQAMSRLFDKKERLPVDIVALFASIRSLSSACLYLPWPQSRGNVVCTVVLLLPCERKQKKIKVEGRRHRDSHQKERKRGEGRCWDRSGLLV